MHGKDGKGKSGKESGKVGKHAFGVRHILSMGFLLSMIQIKIKYNPQFFIIFILFKYIFRCLCTIILILFILQILNLLNIYSKKIKINYC